MTVFRHAVASFDPTPGSVLLWTRLTEASSATWEIATDAGFEQVVGHGTVETGPERDHTVEVDAGGLEPAATYWYRFQSGSEYSPLGRTRTLPDGKVESFTLGIVSCARYSVAPLTVYRALAQAEVDVVLHLGDYIYDDAGEKGPRSQDPSRDLITLEDYRLRLAQIREDPDAQALHMRHPMVWLWDDHDFADNAWVGGAKTHDPEEHGEWRERRDASIQAHQEWLACRTADPSDPSIIYRSIPIGDLADLVLVDSRIAGRDCQASVPGSKTIDDPTRTLLGERQRQWLAGRLADTSRPWALVANGVVINPIPLSLPMAKLTRPLLPEGYVTLDNDQVLRDDQWDGYLAERDRLVEMLGRRAGAGARTILLSGDVHSSWAFCGPEGPDGTPVALEATTPSVSSAPLGRTRLPGLWRLLDRSARQMDHVRWAEITARGFSVVQVVPEQVRVGWWFVDPYDTGVQPGTRVGAAFVSRLKAWPPDWEESPEPVLPTDRPPADHLPARPDDLNYIKRWHLRRRYGVLALVAAGLAIPIGAPARLLWRKMRR
ncbi:MAG: alkaline phosphatase D family protein [Actinomycetota bacterium]